VDLRTTEVFVIPKDTVTPRVTSADIAKIIPTDMAAGESGTMVMTRIADKSFNLWFNSTAMQDSPLVRIAEKTQKTLNTDVVVAAKNPNEVSHKISFRVEAFQALAKLEYSGWTKCVVNYDAKVSQTNVELKEKVFHNKDLVLSHKKNPAEGLSMIGLAWTW
jgi:hypothetical protein